jgi:NADPH:quinone reductase-like Zn-dependent oxidoreductase
VTAVCGPSHTDFVTSLGADRVLDYTKDESMKCLEEYDLVIDTVGKRKTSELKKVCAQALRAKGKYLSIDDEALLLSSDRLTRLTELVELGVIKPVNDRSIRLSK